MWRALFLAAAVALPLSARAKDETKEVWRRLPNPPYPYESLAKHEEGMVVVQVRFDASGEAASCTVVRALASEAMVRATRDFILARWKAPALASQTIQIPIIYDTHRYVPDGFSPAPPNFLKPGDPERQVKIRAIFDKNGLVKSVTVLKSSGSKEVDQRTADWIDWYWCRFDWADRILDIPIDFQPPAGEKK